MDSPFVSTSTWTSKVAPAFTKKSLLPSDGLINFMLTCAEEEIVTDANMLSDKIINNIVNYLKLTILFWT